MARHGYTERAPDAEEGSWARLDSLSQTGDWGTEWSAPGSNGVRLEPCDPTEVYAHPAGWSDDVDDVPVHVARAKRRTWSRGVVSLMWAGVIAVAAVQHAGEIERRANTHEPSTSELDMHERPARQIKAAWRDLGDRDNVAPSVLQAQESQPVLTGNPVAGPVRLVAPIEEARPSRDFALAELRTPEPGVRQKSEGRGDIALTVTNAPIIEAKNDVPVQAEAKAVTPSTSPTQREGADKGPANLIRVDEKAQNAAQTMLNPTALRAERPVETPRQRQRWTRKPRATAARIMVANVIVTPGEFVLEQYFTVYGLNGRTP